ncbi:hypothetical protein TNCV_4625841 [Trichonephila clavipes]|nr:hypothetical protein TNCV_4625841 [Trichonephila clavipes]
MEQKVPRSNLPSFIGDPGRTKGASPFMRSCRGAIYPPQKQPSSQTLTQISRLIQMTQLPSHHAASTLCPAISIMEVGNWWMPNFSATQAYPIGEDLGEHNVPRETVEHSLCHAPMCVLYGIYTNMK